MNAKTLRRRCKHPDRTVIATWTHPIRDYCPDCGAQWPITTRDAAADTTG